jgi:hypothetical protein
MESPCMERANFEAQFGRKDLLCPYALYASIWRWQFVEWALCRSITPAAENFDGQK